MKNAKPVLKIAFPVIAAICTAIFTPWMLLWISIAPAQDTVQEQVDKAIGYGLDGIVVYVDQAGKEPAFYTAGWKNRENQIPSDPHELFKIASISKLYVAAAAAKLVSDETLSLDKTLAEYLPELKGRIEYADQITLRMMIKHRSGIPNFTDHPDYPWDNPYKENLDALKLVLDEPADFKPDSRYRYSNTNYLLIGEILDKALGYSHRQYVKEEILLPLNLSNTYGLLSEVDIEKVASGYYVGYDKDIKYNDFVNPSGSMVATAQDVGIFLRALNDGTLLSDEEQAIYSSVYIYEHTGLLPGYSSIARYHKDIDTIVILFVNTSGGKSWSIVSKVYKRIIKILRSENA